MARRTEAEKALRRLQGAVRSRRLPDPIVRQRVIPRDLATPDAAILVLGPAEDHAFAEALAAVQDDLRLEHLDTKADEAVWRLACRSDLDRMTDHVAAFMGEHSREVMQRRCYFPIEGLTVTERREVTGGTLLPVDDPEVPEPSLGYRPESPAGSVLAVDARGTHLGRMADRARRSADQALRGLRIALREHRSVNDRQLRFRRGTGYSFGEGLSGWQRPPDAISDLAFDDTLAAIVAESPVAAIPSQARTDVERKAAHAMTWLERASLATEPLEIVLFSFFALETLLGDESAGKKGRLLAFRRAMLGEATHAGFSHPDRLHELYEEVRSVAVHGGIPPDITEREARRFAWDVRDALHEYLKFASDKAIRKRGALLRALDCHPRRDDLLNALREFGRADWAEFGP